MTFLHLFYELVIVVAMTTAIADNSSLAVRRRTAASIRVEGCFSNFSGPGVTKDFGIGASNTDCQDYCRDQGYLLAGTKGQECECTNIYPTGYEIADKNCRRRCRSYTACFSTQECCGGTKAWTVSVVGNIDVAKQVLRRIARAWGNKRDYRDHMLEYVKVPFHSQTADWWTSFGRQGWSTCPNGLYMTGLWRNRPGGTGDFIYLLEMAKCESAAEHLKSLGEGDRDCYNLDIWSKWDTKNWATCKRGYYMHGMYRTSGHKLSNIENFKCCKPKSQESRWGRCYNLDAWTSLGKKGWTSCNSGYYMVGMWRNDCNNLHCIELLKCCEMGSFKGGTWASNPSVSIKIKDNDGNMKECSMNVMDSLATTSSYSCRPVSKLNNAMWLDATSFTVEDQTKPTTAQPERVDNFSPVICTASTNGYECSKTLTNTITTSSTLSIRTGISMAATFGGTVGVEAGGMGVTASKQFNYQVQTTASLDVEASKTKINEVSDKTIVTVDVPANKQVMIDLLRKKVDIVYKWKAVLGLLGKYKLEWKNGDNTVQDVTSVLTGGDREIYTFGHWNYPETDVLQVLVTSHDQSTTACEHSSGSGGINCAVQA